MTTLRFRAAALAIASAAAVGAVWSAPAFARSGDVVRAGACSRTSHWKLKLGPRGAVIETQFEVDSNRVGQRWTVKIADNRATVLQRTAKTVAPSGSFSVGVRATNRAGTDSFVATARNAATGETCVGRASV
jgi:hypothetical protein